MYWTLNFFPFEGFHSLVNLLLPDNMVSSSYVSTRGRRRRRFYNLRPGQRVYIDTIHPSRYKVGRECAASKVDDHRGSARYREAKTPAESARKCLGRVRLGKDTHTLYCAVRQLVRNSHYAGTSGTGRGYHVRYLWKKVYVRKTRKPFHFSGEHRTKFLRGAFYRKALRASLT